MKQAERRMQERQAMKERTDAARERARTARQQQAAEHRQKVVAYYLDGHTLEETGAAFSVTRERVRQILNMEGVTARHGQSIRNARRQEYIESIREGALEAYRAGEDMRSIAKRVGISYPALVDALRDDISRLEACRHKSMRRAGKAQRHTDDDLLSTLLTAHADLDGKHLSVKRYVQWRKQHGGPGELTITKRFGSWNRALSLAGLTTKDSPEGFGVPKYSDEDILAAVRRVQVEHCEGRLPSIDQYELHRAEGEPVPATIRLRFGTWHNVLEALEAS